LIDLLILIDRLIINCSNRVE